MLGGKHGLVDLPGRDGIAERAHGGRGREFIWDMSIQFIIRHADTPNVIVCASAGVRDMPGMSGKETLAELRRIRPNVKVILTSGYDEQEVGRRFGRLTDVEFLQKPFLGQQLFEKLREVLGGGDSGGC